MPFLRGAEAMNATLKRLILLLLIIVSPQVLRGQWDDGRAIWQAPRELLKDGAVAVAVRSINSTSTERYFLKDGQYYYEVIDCVIILVSGSKIIFRCQAENNHRTEFSLWSIANGELAKEIDRRSRSAFSGMRPAMIEKQSTDQKRETILYLRDPHSVETLHNSLQRVFGLRDQKVNRSGFRDNVNP